MIVAVAIIVMSAGSGVLGTAAPLAAAPPAATPAPSPTPLSLADAVMIASKQAPAAAIAELETHKVEARRQQVRSALLPSIEGTAGESNRTFNKNTLGFSFPSLPGLPPSPDLVGPFDTADARLRAAQTLFDPADWARWRAAGVSVEASRAERSSSNESAAHAAALAYLGALRSQALLEAREADEALAVALEDLTESRLKAGVSPGIEVTRARTQLAAARFAVVAQRNQLDRSQIELALSLGVDPSRRFVLADSLSEALGASAAPGDPAAAIAFASARRPDLAAADDEVRRARAERSATQAERLPRIDVAADWGVSGPRFGDAITTREVSVAMTLPILDGLRREGRVAEQTAGIDQQEVRARDLRDRVAAEITAALLDLESGRQQTALARERLALAEEEVSQARDRFTSGVAGNIEVIDAQSSLVRARETDVDARYATALARIALARAAGVAQTLK
jgi:outer membrane protein TolC